MPDSRDFRRISCSLHGVGFCLTSWYCDVDVFAGSSGAVLRLRTWAIVFVCPANNNKNKDLSPLIKQRQLQTCETQASFGSGT